MKNYKKIIENLKRERCVFLNILRAHRLLSEKFREIIGNGFEDSIGLILRELDEMDRDIYIQLRQILIIEQETDEDVAKSMLMRFHATKTGHMPKWLALEKEVYRLIELLEYLR